MLERAGKRLVSVNNVLVRRADPGRPNPRDVADEPWCVRLVEAHAEIRAEWDAFAGSGGQLPLIDDFLGGHQGNTGSWWRAGGLIARSRPMPPLADRFPRTVEALLAVPDLLGAMWSVLGPGGELLPHTGDNAGSLNYLIGVDCPAASGLSIEGREVDASDGSVVVFDDTRTHATWNLSERPRVVLIGDILRDLPGLGGWANRAAQAGRHHLSPGYRRAVDVGAELHAALND